MSRTASESRILGLFVYAVFAICLDGVLRPRPQWSEAVREFESGNTVSVAEPPSPPQVTKEHPDTVRFGPGTLERLGFETLEVQVAPPLRPMPLDWLPTIEPVAAGEAKGQETRFRMEALINDEQFQLLWNLPVRCQRLIVPDHGWGRFMVPIKSEALDPRPVRQTGRLKATFEIDDMHGTVQASHIYQAYLEFETDDLLVAIPHAALLEDGDRPLVYVQTAADEYTRQRVVIALRRGGLVYVCSELPDQDPQVSEHESYATPMEQAPELKPLKAKSRIISKGLMELYLMQGAAKQRG